MIINYDMSCNDCVRCPFSSHPVYPCPVVDFCSVSDCKFPFLTCHHCIACHLLTVEIFGGPIDCLMDLLVQAPVSSCDPEEVTELICCAQNNQDCLDALYGIDTIDITPACTAYCGPVSGKLYVDLRRCTAWFADINAPILDCA